MLAAADDASKYIWYYSRSNMTTSTAPRISTLSYGRYSLSYSSRGLATHSSYYQDGDSAWDYDGKLLSYHGGSSVFYLQYKPESDVQLTFTRNPAEASEIIAYSCGETLSRCIIRQPAAESYVTEGSGYPAPEFYVGLSDVTADRIEWFVNGRRQSCTAQSFTAEMLANQPAGVHRVQCRVEAHDSRGLHYREQSAEATFVIAKGVIPDSVLTFSDIHEEYFLIGQAFERVLAETGGYLPALVICTGDFVYGPTVDRDTELNRYFPQIVSQLGGLDAVFVAGNHDSGEAASVMSARRRIFRQRAATSSTANRKL